MIFVLSYVPVWAYMVSQLFCSIALAHWIAFGCLGGLLLRSPNIWSDGFFNESEDNPDMGMKSDHKTPIAL